MSSSTPAGTTHPAGAFSKPWPAFVCSALAAFMATLDGGIVNVGLPSISGNFGVDVLDAQAVTAVYLLAVSAALPLAGRLCDRLGVKDALRIGYTVFTLASILCGAAPGLYALIAGRVLQALGASLMMASGPAVVMTAFPGRERGRALGFIGMTVALGSLVGPALGGLIIHNLGWRWVFYVNAPIGAAAVLWAGTALRESTRGRAEPLDLPGALYFGAGLTLFMAALLNGRDWTAASPKLWAVALGAAAAFGLFIKREKQVQAPLFDVKLLKNMPFSTGLAAALLSFCALFSNVIFMPFYLQNELGLSPADAGLVMAVLPGVMVFVAPLAGRLSESVNLAGQAALGLFVSAAALTGLSFLSPEAGVWGAIVGQAGLGVGVGVFQSPNAGGILSQAPKDRSGVVGSMLSLVRNLGMALGVALSGLVFDLFRAEAFMPGFSAALRFGAAAALAGALLSLHRRRWFRSV